MKINLDLPISELLKIFIEETHSRKREDLLFHLYLENYVKNPYDENDCRGIEEAFEYLRWAIVNDPIDRSCLERQSIDLEDRDNSDNIPF